MSGTSIKPRITPSILWHKANVYKRWGTMGSTRADRRNLTPDAQPLFRSPHPLDPKQRPRWPYEKSEDGFDSSTSSDSWNSLDYEREEREEFERKTGPRRYCCGSSFDEAGAATLDALALPPPHVSAKGRDRVAREAARKAASIPTPSQPLASSPHAQLPERNPANCDESKERSPKRQKMDKGKGKADDTDASLDAAVLSQLESVAAGLASKSGSSSVDPPDEEKRKVHDYLMRSIREENSTMSVEAANKVFGESPEDADCLVPAESGEA
ncbi:hypothetical protein B9479_006327 [Cryptococcus floricola]|uniref:Uncharacterized protein n=1 Tax=Cryptococcus floricola TaxID=2591691 RepID=A0A5D3AS48_9TREE|nr:hypothetical protein B9479_006327 [Cryptococcus floricola]